MIADIISGFSKALYSTWIHYKPDHFLLDCGEGAATVMGNGTYSIEKVLLTHGHMDHIAGLPVFLGARAAAMGDTQKPLQIYYPAGDFLVELMRDYIRKSCYHITYPLEWIPLEVGAKVPLRSKRFAETFRTHHAADLPTFGYRIMEPRRHLKAKHAHLTREEIADLAKREGHEAVEQLSETYLAKLAVFSGDGLALPPQEICDAEILFHESTFLDKADRMAQRHPILEEVMEAAVVGRVKSLVLYHVSGRYHLANINDAIRKMHKKYQINFPIWILHENQLMASK